MKSILSLSLLALLGFLLTFTTPLTAQTTTTAPKEKKIPFHGKLMAVDGTANTITIEGKTPRVFHLTPTTKIIDGSGKPTTLLTAVVGEDVGGSYAKDATGTMTLFSVRLGAKTKAAGAASTTTAPAPAPTTTSAPAPAPAPAVAPEPTTTAPATTPVATTAAKVKKQTFSGKVVSVDATGGTLVVHGKADQTFTVTPTTKIVDATGAASTLAAVTAGAKVSGSYSKSTDGATLTVYTLKIGK